MKLNPSEFISKAEGLKSWEINTRQKLESIRSERLSIQSQIETLEYRLDSLYLELESLQDDEDEETDNSAAIASVRAEISATQEEISDYEAQDAELSIEESETEEELRQIELEEQETLADIQDSASRTKNNIVLISSFGGDYANVSAQATSSFQHNLGQLSQAAQILGGSVSMGAIGNGGGRSISSANPPALSTGRNFYEAANNQRNNGSGCNSSLGARSNGSSGSRKTGHSINNSEEMDDNSKPTKSLGGFGKKALSAMSKLVGQGFVSTTSEFNGFDANKVGNNSWHIKGAAYEAYKNFYDNMGNYTISGNSSSDKSVVMLNPNQIEGITISTREVQNPDTFWGQHKSDGSFESFLEIAKKIPAVQNKLNSGVSINDLINDPDLGQCASIYFDTNSPSAVRVLKGDGFYEFEYNGRHRILAARALGYSIPVIITGEIKQRSDISDHASTKNTSGLGRRSNISQSSSTSPQSVRSQILQTNVTRQMERTFDYQLRENVHGILKTNSFSKERWDTLSIPERKTVLSNLVDKLNGLLGTQSSIGYYFEVGRSRGKYVDSEKKVKINEYFLANKNSYKICQTVIHEMRHAYQHYAVANPDKVTVSKETIAAWKDNFANYLSPLTGCTFDEYVSQPVEWDAKNFAKQCEDVLGCTPTYSGSWGNDSNQGQ